VVRLAGIGRCVIATCVIACSGGSTTDNAATGGTGGASTGMGGDAGKGGVTSASGGMSPGTGGNGSTAGATATGGGSATGGGAGQAALTCKGQFGVPRLHFDSDAGAELASPTVTPDELELVYTVETSGGTDWRFMRATRASTSALFTAGAPVSELESACATGLRRTGAFTSDGLRLYFVCYTDSSQVVPLRVARRATRAAPFVIDAMTYGTVAPSPSPSRDELELFSTQQVDPILNELGLARYTRTTREQAFGSPSPVRGLESVNGATPTLSPDGLELLFYVGGGIVAAYRPSLSEAFGTPVPFTSLAQTGSEVFGAPEISQDCHTVYVIHVVRHDAADLVYSIMSASR